MLKRLAFFEGRVAEGRDAEFDGYIRERLLPLWNQFPGATRVEVLREVEAEDGSHRYPLVLGNYLCKSRRDRDGAGFES